jgi:C-terminal processing protease CtpA/Prc
MVVPDKASVPAPPATPFYGEVLEDHIGYVRPGSLQNASLQLLDKKLIEFSSKKIDGLIIDLRSSSTDDFPIAAEFAKRFCARGKTLFTVQKAGKSQKTFVSDRDPTFKGLTLILIDDETAGGAEAVASAIRSLNKVLAIGATTAGAAVEYADLPLPSGKILRVATAEIAGPDGQSIYPNGVKPDLPVELATADKRQIFQMSLDRGMGPFVQDVERPHFNEAALLAGTNPELESAEQRRGRNADRAPHDAVVQRALDVITSLEVYQKR